MSLLGCHKHIKFLPPHPSHFSCPPIETILLMELSCLYQLNQSWGREGVALHCLNLSHTPKPVTNGESLLPEERREESVCAGQTKRLTVVYYNQHKSSLRVLLEGQVELWLCLFEFKQIRVYPHKCMQLRRPNHPELQSRQPESKIFMLFLNHSLYLKSIVFASVIWQRHRKYLAVNAE